MTDLTIPVQVAPLDVTTRCHVCHGPLEPLQLIEPRRIPMAGAVVWVHASCVNGAAT